jgi:hypothetical protein
MARDCRGRIAGHSESDEAILSSWTAQMQCQLIHAIASLVSVSAFVAQNSGSIPSSICDYRLLSMAAKPKPEPSMAKVRDQFKRSGLTLHDLGVKMGYAPDSARKSVWQFIGRTAIRA